MNILKVFKESYKKLWYILKISEITRQKQQKETIMIIIINPFHANVLSLYSLNALKNHTQIVWVCLTFLWGWHLKGLCQMDYITKLKNKCLPVRNIGFIKIYEALVTI